jgi:hypothetical protein
MKLFVCAVLVFLCVGLCLHGALVAPISLERLVEQSQIIVEGRVVRSWSTWDPKHKYIWTHHEVQVSDDIRGAGRATAVVSEPGGSLGGVHQLVTGALPYAKGENVVLFLYRTPIGYWRTTGGGQGKFMVCPDGRVHAAMQGLQIADARRTPSASPAKRGTPLRVVEYAKVTDFKARVRKLVRTQPEREAH